MNRPGTKRHMEGFVIGDSRVHKTIADVLREWSKSHACRLSAYLYT